MVNGYRIGLLKVPVSNLRDEAANLETTCDDSDNAVDYINNSPCLVVTGRF